MKTTKVNLRVNRENLNQLSKSFRQIGEYDSCAKYELQNQISRADQKVMNAQFNLESLQGILG